MLSVSDKEQNIGCTSALVVECLEALEGAIHRCLEIGAAAGHLSCIRDVEQHPEGRVVGGKGNLNKRLIGKDNQADPISLQAVHKPVEFQLRSEEHTSELQSRGHLVCRLLLEKKKRR